MAVADVLVAEKDQRDRRRDLRRGREIEEPDSGEAGATKRVRV
jgi:hypothetical protein